jgi:hypothetical protein
MNFNFQVQFLSEQTDAYITAACFVEKVAAIRKGCSVDSLSYLVETVADD